MAVYRGTSTRRQTFADLTQRKFIPLYDLRKLAISLSYSDLLSATPNATLLLIYSFGNSTVGRFHVAKKDDSEGIQADLLQGKHRCYLRARGHVITYALHFCCRNRGYPVPYRFSEKSFSTDRSEHPGSVTEKPGNRNSSDKQPDRLNCYPNQGVMIKTVA